MRGLPLQSFARSESVFSLALFVLAAAHSAASPLIACGTPDTKARLAAFLSPEQVAHMDHEMDMTVIPYALAAPTECIGGMADIFPCRNIDLLAVIQPSALGSTNGNDMWGWTDPMSGNEYALIGLKNGTAFLDVTDPENPIYVGKLPSHGGESNDSSWRDIKVYENTAYVVQDYPDMPHGLQIFDLTQLRAEQGTPAVFTETNHYPGFARSHNLVINEETGFLYVVGTEGTVCSGGISMFDLNKNPQNPELVGCFGGDGYTHDAQCVVYTGPDEEHQGKEICFASNEDTVTIVDVTDKKDPEQLSRTTYPNLGYSHQGWLTDDQRYFVHDDESDESAWGHNTKTRIFDVSDLDNPVQRPDFLAQLGVNDHNQYIVGEFTFQANYRGGLRILHIDDPQNGILTEVAFLDTYPDSNSTGYSGAWSVYPFFASGTVLISDINRGLFVVRPHLEGVTPFFEDGFESGDTTAW